MAQQYVTTDGTLVIPGAYPKVSVQRQNSGLATTGVIALVGEASTGPRFDEETDLEVDAVFGPDQAAAVVAKYGDGQLVDAYRAASQPSNDPNIVGAPSRFVLVKTNGGSKSSVALPKIGGGTYGTLYTKIAGRNGNQLYETVDALTAEVIPTTGNFTWIPPVSSLNMEIRANGGAALTPTVTANITPTAFVSTVNGLSGVASTGGAARTTIQNSVGTLALAIVSGNSVTITYASGTFTTTPSVGDTVVIPLTSVIRGSLCQNVGAYVVTAATSTVITCTKLSDAGFTYARLAYDTQTGNFTVGQVVTGGTSNATGTIVQDLDGGSTGTLVLSGVSGTFQDNETITDPITGSAAANGTQTVATAGTITAPAAVTAQAVSGTAANDMVVYAPVVITLEAGNVLDGVGKSLEIAELTTGTDRLSRCAYNLSTSVVTWVSKSGTPALIASATEYSVQLNVTRQNDGISEELTAGGDIALRISYAGDTATMSVSATALTTTVTGGSGDNLNLALADYTTIADLAAYINAQTGYSCAVGTTTLGQQPSASLDRVTAMGICSKWGAKNGRLKMDALKFYQAIVNGSAVVQLGSTPARAAAGLPDVVATSTYFAGGAKGSSATSDFTEGLDALEQVSCNFVVTCVSRDAADDITDGLTDSGSSYAIDSVNAYLRTHCLAMSKLKKKRNRQGFASIQTSFSDARNAAANLASFRVAMTFQDIKNTNSNGTLVQFQPWMGAAVAAGMQAAGFYRAIVRKFANISGAVMASGDFSDRDDTAMENALLSGLLPLKRHSSGGFYWVSDQTTYSRDDNFVYNSIQAVYAADVIALTTAQRMEDAFAGQSVADVSASAALTFLQGIMADFRRLKLIAASDDAPAGFKNARITISGPAMLVEVEVKLAGAIYFIPINFLVSPVQQTANQ